ncbi:MAG: hypothetical protein GQ561_06910, partial [Calditrichae bacterium]|nr:hypothetical protein [Calditrichia bacterium]
MIFDFDMINNFYKTMNEKQNTAREKTGHALTLTDKILYSHLAHSLDKVPEREKT